MAITIYLRNTTSHVGTIGTNGNFDLETTTGTTATQSMGSNTGAKTYVYYSAAGWPNLLDWQTGDYTYFLDVTTANANVQLTSIKVSRYNAALNTEKASGTATINLTLSTTGVKTGTITFASPNPAGTKAIDDRLVVTITITKLGGGGTQSVNTDVNGSADSRLDTPLTPPIIRNISEPSVSVSESVAKQVFYTKPISEPSVSVSESLDDTETYVKPISESAISVSGSVEATKQEGGTILYNVHFVEFPEEVTDSLYVPPPSAVEQVSTTKTHKYDVIGKITKSVTHKFNLIGLVQKSVTHKYNLLSQVIKSVTSKFNIIAKVTATKTHVFSILAAITRTRTHKYNVLQQIIKTRTHKYDVASSIIEVSTTKTHKYNVTSPFTQVSTTKTHKFSIIAKVIKTKTHVFSVITRVLASKTHKYNVIQRITKTKTYVFSVIARVLTQKTHIYSVIQQIVRTRTHKYNVAGRITATKTHKFNIITKITTTKTHKYNLLNRISPDRTRTHKFNILALVTRTRTHKYNIIGRITRTKTHRYVMGGKVLSTKTHKYNVGLGTVLQELGGSTNAYVRFQDRVQIIDIIADLNNLAIANVEIAIARPPANIATATVAIAEYSSKLLTASVHKPRHRIASRLIIPQVIDTIENLAVAPYIGIEILPIPQQPQLQAKSNIQLLKSQFLHLQSQTQLSQDDKTKIRIASSTMLQQTQETIIGSRAQLEIQAFPRPILAPEIMTRQKAKILKTLVNLLSSDELFS